VSQIQRIAHRYEVRPLEGGGMGVIWQGYDTVLDRLVAIKQIRSDQFSSSAEREELAERFRREARITAKIEHPGVPAVYDAAIDRDPANPDRVEQLYLVMQLVHGVTVADLLAENGPLAVPWAVAIAAQICSVLSYAHAIPVVHRDLKPSNVMVDLGGHVKVLDFGVAAVLGTDVTRLTETGRLIGSREYMSPEQFHGVGVSPRSDLYALGCLLHEMLTATRLFDGTRDPALRHVYDTPTPLRALRPDVHEAIERLVLDLLAKSPADRPESAQDVYDRLVPFLPSRADAGPPDGERPSAGVPDPTQPYRQPLAPRRPLVPAPPAMASVPSTAWALPASLANDLDTAEEHAANLVDQERFTQAVGVLTDALKAASPHLAADHPRILDVQSTRAAALFLGGDYRQALTAFDELTCAYSRAAGPTDERAIECRKQAAYCRAELGDNETALAEFSALLQLVGRDRDQSLELRRQIGMLLLAANRLADAALTLEPLYQDLVVAHGADDPDSLEVAELLTRIRLARRHD
jgi:serine/threonine protein kinase